MTYFGWLKLLTTVPHKLTFHVVIPLELNSVISTRYNRNFFDYNIGVSHLFLNAFRGCPDNTICLWWWAHRPNQKLCYAIFFLNFLFDWNCYVSRNVFAFGLLHITMLSWIKSILRYEKCTDGGSGRKLYNSLESKSDIKTENVFCYCYSSTL